jgi:GMP synthase (glutamine-hydrolysing)
LPRQSVLVLDFGGQYNQLIARRVRECNVYCEVKPYTFSLEEIRAFDPIGIIFTGGPNSVYDPSSPQVDPGIFQLGIPILGICYGCQLMAHHLGGRVVAANDDTAREYGKTETYFDTSCKLFQDLPEQGITWMSHGDYMEKVPEGFTLAARSDACPNVAIADEKRGFYGVQYHPEVNHTQHGTDMIHNFLYSVCGAKGEWTMGDYKNTAIATIREKVGNGRVLLALSGGVDSSVAAALLAEAVGKQLTCVFVDHGLLRLNEGDEVEAAFRPWDINFVRVDAEARFLSKLAGVTSRSTSARSSARSSSGSLKRRPRRSALWTSWPRAPSIPTSSSPAPATPPSSRATTTWAACRIMLTSKRSSSRCGCSSRTRSVSWAGSWACRSIW